MIQTFIIFLIILVIIEIYSLKNENKRLNKYLTIIQFKLEDKNKENEKLKTKLKLYKTIEDIIFNKEVLKEIQDFIEIEEENNDELNM